MGVNLRHEQIASERWHRIREKDGGTNRWIHYLDLSVCVLRSYLCQNCKLSFTCKGKMYDSHRGHRGQPNVRHLMSECVHHTVYRCTAFSNEVTNGNCLLDMKAATNRMLIQLQHSDLPLVQTGHIQMLLQTPTWRKTRCLPHSQQHN